MMSEMNQSFRVIFSHHFESTSNCFITRRRKKSIKVVNVVNAQNDDQFQSHHETSIIETEKKRLFVITTLELNVIMGSLQGLFDERLNTGVTIKGDSKVSLSFLWTCSKPA